MRKIVAGLAITLDGVVESPRPWMRFDDEMMAIIHAGIVQSDAILLGRSTYLDFAAMWPSLGSEVPMADWMNNTPKYVLSNTLTRVDWANSTLVTGDLAGVVNNLRARPGKNIQVPGSPRLVRALLREGLLDELSLTIHPIVVGSGLRLFDELTRQVDLNLVSSTTLRSGVLAATYQPVL